MILRQDLAFEAATVIQHGLNELPAPLRERVADASEAGGEVELRFRPGSPASVSLWLVNQAGASVELARC